MYDELYLINQIKTSTGFTDVDYADETLIDLIHQELTAPRVFVGHLGIKLQQPENMYANGYNELENPEVLVTGIQFICQRSALAATRIAIKAAYTAFSPFPSDGDYSSLVFLEASTVAKTSTKIIWQELVGLVMPRVS